MLRRLADAFKRLKVKPVVPLPSSAKAPEFQKALRKGPALDLSATEGSTMGYKFYAVRKGHRTGVFTSWPECQAATNKFSGPVFKGFNDRAEAEAFVAGGPGSSSASFSSAAATAPQAESSSAPFVLLPSGPKYRFYAVRKGWQVGVFDRWELCQQAIKNFTAPSFRGFDDFAEAQAFVSSGSGQSGSAAAAAAPAPTFSSSSSSSSSYGSSSSGGRGASLLSPSSTSQNWRIRPPKPVPRELESMAAAPTQRLVIRSDGGARGNPGVAGSGAVVISTFTGKVVASSYSYIGDRETNNTAEYRAMGLALRLIKQLNLPFSRVQAIEGDSNLVISQLKGEWKVDKPHLALEKEKIGNLAQELSGIEGWGPTPADAQRKFVSLLAHTRRENNSDADYYSNVAMDRRESGPVIAVDNTFFIKQRAAAGAGKAHDDDDDDDEVVILAHGLGSAGSAGVGQKRKAPSNDHHHHRPRDDEEDHEEEEDDDMGLLRQWLRDPRSQNSSMAITAAMAITGARDQRGGGGN
jgi:ribonuclease HI